MASLQLLPHKLCMYVVPTILSARASMAAHAGGSSANIRTESEAWTDLVTSLHSPAEDSAKGVKRAAVLLRVKLGNVHKQRTSRVACLDVLNNLSILRAGVQSLNLHQISLQISFRSAKTLQNTVRHSAGKLCNSKLSKNCT